jgi:Domain of unknown function (DUF4372)
MRLFKRSEITDKPVLKQIIDFISQHLLFDFIKKHKSYKVCSTYKTFDQLVALTFGQVCKCYILSDLIGALI